MRFVVQALHRRPLEPKSLAMGRGGSAILLSMTFLAYVGYLIHQIYTDSPLILFSTQSVEYYPLPDIKICANGSPLTITACNFWKSQTNITTVPGCAPYVKYLQISNGSWCAFFQRENINYGSSQNSINDTSVLFSFDMYWRIDNITAFSLRTTWPPYVGVQFYPPHNTNPIFLKDKKKADDLIAQNLKPWDEYAENAYSPINTWRGFFIALKRYRAIRPYDVLSILGVKSTYEDFDALNILHDDWPLNREIVNYTKYGDFHGAFSVDMSYDDLEIKTEQRQRTVLAAVALAGGCYGMIFAVHTLLYGTPKLAPFGFTHNLSIWYHRIKFKLKNREDHLLSDLDIEAPVNASTFVDSSITMDTAGKGNKSDLHSVESRLDELESILREYFLDVDSLDDFRTRRQRTTPDS